MVDAQQWLDKNYPQERKNEIKFMDIRDKDLEGELKLDGFTHLEVLQCLKNKLTNLKIINCLNVRHLNVSCNELTDLNFLSGLDLEKLVF